MIEYDWPAFVFALVCVGFGVWWMQAGGNVLITAGFFTLAVVGIGKWWAGR